MTAVILAGGKSSRMGRDKLMLEYGGMTLLESAARRFEPFFDEVWLSVDGAAPPETEYRCIRDLYPGLGPISGLHAALSAADGDGVFLVAADMPCASPPAALRLIGLRGDSGACVLSNTAGQAEPLFGYYGRELVNTVETEILAGRYKMSALLKKIGARIVAPEELGELWDESMLLNINYPQDYERLMGGFTGYNGDL